MHGQQPDRARHVAAREGHVEAERVAQREIAEQLHRFPLGVGEARHLREALRENAGTTSLGALLRAKLDNSDKQ